MKLIAKFANIRIPLITPCLLKFIDDKYNMDPETTDQYKFEENEFKFPSIFKKIGVPSHKAGAK